MGVDDVARGATEHDTWVASDRGMAWDEGRADFIMLMMAKTFGVAGIKDKSGVAISDEFGERPASSRLTTTGIGGRTEGAVTSLLVDLIGNQDPCLAMKQLNLATATWTVDQNGRPPQEIQDFLIGLMTHHQNQGASPREMAELDVAIWHLMQTYRIDNEKIGFIHALDHYDGIQDLRIQKIQDRSGNTRYVKWLDFKAVANRLQLGKVNTTIQTRQGRLVIVAHSAYNLEVSTEGVITIAVREGRLDIDLTRWHQGSRRRTRDVCLAEGWPFAARHPTLPRSGFNRSATRGLGGGPHREPGRGHQGGLMVR